MPRRDGLCLFGGFGGFFELLDVGDEGIGGVEVGNGAVGGDIFDVGEFGAELLISLHFGEVNRGGVVFDDMVFIRGDFLGVAVAFPFLDEEE